MPKNWWERVKFPRNYGKTLETIDSIWQLYWPKLLQHKEKNRLTKMTQLRMRKLALRTREKQWSWIRLPIHFSVLISWSVS
ncbi:hypothetical protein F2Q69_00014392 [Brassica cretica]|uniref:Uncharacterized protein n=1 Tax=Brassica cretica TaxID=69181 RepID=A0A8S9R8F4_BRACR|nr:hypothetical protein F2Q69_00014392 [Brassica cretica]